MTREDAARIYLNGLTNKNTDIGRFFEAAKVLSAEDKVKIQMAFERFCIDQKEFQEILYGR